MNLSFTRGDEENAVKDNYRRLSKRYCQITHTIFLVGEKKGKGVTPKNMIPQTR